MVTTSRVRLLAALAALGAVAVATYGSRGSLGLFINPWEDTYDSSRAAVTLTSSVGFLTVAVAQPIAGRLVAVIAPRRLVVLGGALAASGYAGAGWSPSLWLTVGLVGVVAAFGAGVASLPLLSYISAELAPSRQGTVFGVLAAAAAGGQILVLPVATFALGASLTFALFSLALLIAGATAAVFVLMPSLPAAASADDDVTAEPPHPSLLIDPRFWLLIIPFFICGYTTTGLTDTHLIPYAVDHHMSEVRGSAALAVLAAFNVAGVLGSGVFTDRLDRRHMLTVMYASRAGILLLLPALTSPSGLFVFAALFGIVDFATVPPTTALVRSLFGRFRWAMVLGLVSAGHQAGSALGAWAGGAIYDVTGSYTLSFFTAGLLLVLASVLSWALPKEAEEQTEPAPAGV